MSFMIRHIGRLELLSFFFIFIAVVLLAAAFRYTIIDGDYYRNLADRQQTAKITNSVSRGSIYTKNEPIGVLATSADLPDLAIDPTASGSHEALLDFLVQVYRREACGITFDLSCVERSYELMRMPLAQGTKITSQGLDGSIRTFIQSKLSQEYVTSSLLKENLTPQELDTFSRFSATNLVGSGMYLIANNVYVNPMTLSLSDDQKKNLQDMFGLTGADMAKSLLQRKVRYIKILSQMSFATKEFVDERLAQSAGNSVWDIKNFIIIEPNPSRYYPQKTVWSQITGFVDNNGIGRYGIEAYFEKELQWRDGVRSAKKDIHGRTIENFDLDNDRTINGSDITLTIDRNIQKYLGDRLERATKEFRANRVSAVVLNPKTGAIIAMASAPGYDPNEYSRVYDLEVVNPDDHEDIGFDFLGMPLFVEDDLKGSSSVVNGQVVKLRDATEEERANPLVKKYRYKNNVGPLAYMSDPVASLYEPGSIFKPITVAIGIDSGEIRPSDVYYDAGSIKIDQFTISNLAKECIGQHTYTHALNWSCNVGMIDIVKKVGKNIFAEYIRDFWFGIRTNITMKEEVFAEMESVDKWSRSKLYTNSFGQGIATTLIQMAAAYGVLANGGIYMQPYLVDSITLPNGQVQKTEPVEMRRVVKSETTKLVTDMMVEGATIWYAKKGAVAGYKIAGKTGTSQIPSRGWYEKGPHGETIGRTFTSYGWFAPAYDPKFVLILKAERPRTGQYAETTSALVFSDVAKYLLEYYGIPKDK